MKNGYIFSPVKELRDFSNSISKKLNNFFKSISKYHYVQLRFLKCIFKVFELNCNFSWKNSENSEKLIDKIAKNASK